MFVDQGNRTIDFSRNPAGVLNARVLTALRDSLNSTEYFNRLVFDNNRLTEEAIGVLAAILKGSTPIEYLSLRSCNLNDLDIVNIVHPLCFRKVLRHLDLSRNPGITSSSIPEIARAIRTIPTLESVFMLGTDLQERNCKFILSALETSSVSVLELPYTVGFRVLDGVREIIESKKAIEKPPNQRDMRAMAPVPCNARQLPRGVVAPLRDIMPRTPPVLDTRELHNTAPNSLESVDIRHWADPAVKNAVMYMHTLDKRCSLLEMRKQERLAAKRSRMENLADQRGPSLFRI
ncbi:hypothetical protein ERJ75_000730700 [Trypanosoma vivax]|uniref:Uncharacterized protein n=1 Tax=Trypanosoma vivax (strain Y486) TaxID=1055687 RepID=G0TX64_TRYVY|nr:hypothetical protein TRVL_00645 [Trypanosoma vivax]KAH8613587.1 hypothetical protein ERJ75_000730700 [Trypanosoma vivax]CCC48554.1 conserved hypothetical protein [Trypanosoma vivax Y486]